MRKKIVAGNWKMNLSIQEGLKLAKEVNVNHLVNANLNVELILGVPYTHLTSVIQEVGSSLKISAQDCSVQESGAYTGEVSAKMIQSCGANYVILGHSERREYHQETNAQLVNKVNQALKHNLKVIFCCGESLKQREDKYHFEHLKQQLNESIFHLSAQEFSELVIAYEPIWAIGTGLTASARQAQEIHQFLRTLIADKYDNDVANKIPILYGGSCKPNNAQELFAQADIDGGLIGGASLNSDDFIQIAKSF